MLLDSNYARLRKIRLNDYKTNKDPATLKEARELGEKRLNAGNNCFKETGSHFPHLSRLVIYLDLIKMQIQLYQNVIEAMNYAGTVFKIVNEKTDFRRESLMFLDCRGIDAALLKDRKAFIKRLVQICK